MTSTNPSLKPNTYYPSTTWYNYTYTQLKETNNNPKENKAIATRLLAHYLAYNNIQHLLNTPIKASVNTLHKINTAIEKLKQNQPLQYILRYTPFLNLNINTAPGVFIPRPETEQMIHHIITKHPTANNILDLCTGTGCIAISLKKNYPKATVTAIDINPLALQLAKKNSLQLHTPINIFKKNILHNPLPNQTWDLIISNPPYIPLSEKNNLHPKIHHEPHQALFVPTNDPTVFYKRIAHLTKKHLAPKGTLCLEIHENFPQSIKNTLQNNNLKNIQLHKDLHGKPRWITSSK